MSEKQESVFTIAKTSEYAFKVELEKEKNRPLINEQELKAKKHVTITLGLAGILALFSISWLSDSPKDTIQAILQLLFIPLAAWWGSRK